MFRTCCFSVYWWPRRLGGERSRCRRGLWWSAELKSVSVLWRVGWRGTAATPRGATGESGSGGAGARSQPTIGFGGRPNDSTGSFRDPRRRVSVRAIWGIKLGGRLKTDGWRGGRGAGRESAGCHRRVGRHRRESGAIGESRVSSDNVGCHRRTSGAFGESVVIGRMMTSTVTQPNEPSVAL